jgi:hypothetical protein
MQKLDYATPRNETRRSNWQMFADAWIGLGMIAVASLGLSLTAVAKMARGSEQSQGHYMGDRWEPSGRWMGAKLFSDGVRRIFHGRQESR